MKFGWILESVPGLPHQAVLRHLWLVSLSQMSQKWLVPCTRVPFNQLVIPLVPAQWSTAVEEAEQSNVDVASPAPVIGVNTVLAISEYSGGKLWSQVGGTRLRKTAVDHAHPFLCRQLSSHQRRHLNPTCKLIPSGHIPYDMDVHVSYHGTSWGF